MKHAVIIRMDTAGWYAMEKMQVLKSNQTI